MGRLIWSSWICLPPYRVIINYECGVQRHVLSIHKKLDLPHFSRLFVAPLSRYSCYVVANSCNVIAYSHYAVAYSR